MKKPFLLVIIGFVTGLLLGVGGFYAIAKHLNLDFQGKGVQYDKMSRAVEMQSANSDAICAALFLNKPFPAGEHHMTVGMDKKQTQMVIAGWTFDEQGSPIWAWSGYAIDENIKQCRK